MIFSKDGRKLKVGQLVDVPVSHMMTCQVVEIRDPTLTVLDPRDPRNQPLVIVQPLPLAMNVGKNGANNLVAPDVYIVKADVPDAPKDKDTDDDEHEPKRKSPLKLVS